MSRTTLASLSVAAALVSTVSAARCEPPAYAGEARERIRESRRQAQQRASDNAERTEKGIVILVEFPDVANAAQRSTIQMRFNQGLSNYVREMSYGKVALDVDVTDKILEEVGDSYRILVTRL